VSRCDASLRKSYVPGDASSSIDLNIVHFADPPWKDHEV
jgi:hypothetical protein